MKTILPNHAEYQRTLSFATYSPQTRHLKKEKGHPTQGTHTPIQPSPPHKEPHAPPPFRLATTSDYRPAPNTHLTSAQTAITGSSALTTPSLTAARMFHTQAAR